MKSPQTDNADLRAAAEAATPGPYILGEREKEDGSSSTPVHFKDGMVARVWRPNDARFAALASPDRILGILDELGRKTAALEDLVLAASVKNNPALPRLIEQARAALEGKPAPSSMTGEK